MKLEVKLKNILFWVRNTVTVFKKDTELLIESSDINISDISRIYIVVGGDHGQGAFRFSMKILNIINNGNRKKKNFDIYFNSLI